MPGEDRPGGGTSFFVTWENIEKMFRGNTSPELIKPDERAEYVVYPAGVKVFVEKRQNADG